MKIIILTLFLVAIICACQSYSIQQQTEDAFLHFQKKYNKVYGDEETFKQRFAVFTQNFKEIQEINSKGLTWEAGVNQYSDMTWEEFKQWFHLAPQECSATGQKSLPSANIPSNWDWRDYGKVQKVKNQGNCGSCWAFSTVGSLESTHAIQKGKLYDLSESQLVDCAQGFNNFGCHGGLPSQAFEYVAWAGGIQTEETYPYVASDEKCVFNVNKTVVHTRQSFNITAGDEDTMHQAISGVTAISVAYQVVSDFRHYKSGVYQSTECKNSPMDVNHAVLAVGFSTDAPIPYYTIKNSWGEDWGDQGYFKIKSGDNMCGIAVCSSFPILAL